MTIAACSAVVLCAAFAAALPVQDPPLSTVPQPRTDEGGAARQSVLLERVRTAGPSPVVFIGDSITQGWEHDGSALWAARFAPRGALNLGASGDRTEHVLWRLREAPIGRLDPKAVVIMIGTNNLGHGRDDASRTLAGVRAVVDLVRAQAPNATVLLLAIFPRGEQMNPMRGELLQVNQALARAYAPDSDKVRVIDIGTRFIEPDGSIPKSLMPDALHLSAAGYAVWADALSPELERIVPAPSEGKATQGTAPVR